MASSGMFDHEGFKGRSLMQLLAMQAAETRHLRLGRTFRCQLITAATSSERKGYLMVTMLGSLYIPVCRACTGIGLLDWSPDRNYDS